MNLKTLALATALVGCEPPPTEKHEIHCLALRAMTAVAASTGEAGYPSDPCPGVPSSVFAPPDLSECALDSDF